MQVNMMSAYHDVLISLFKIDATTLAFASSFLFYANIIFMLPAGLIIDRYPIKTIILINMLIVIFATLAFALSTNIYYIAISRFFVGIMMSFALISCLKIASILFTRDKMALMSSLIVSIGMLGGFFALLPIEALIKRFGFRASLMFVAFIGVAIMIILWFATKTLHGDLNKESLQKKESKILYHLFQVMKYPQNWFNGLFITTLNLPLAVLGALFGIAYIQQAYGYSSIQASSITALLFIGFIFGSPFFGWLSNFLKSKKIPMYLGSLSCLVLILILLYVPNLNFLLLEIIFFLVGFTSAAQVLGYPLIEQNNPKHLTGTALGLASLLIMGMGYGVSLPFVGWLIDLGRKGASYSRMDYEKAFIIIPIGIAISILMIFFSKEQKTKG
jgi:MFS family permease